jgi:hypothetical protein
MNETQFNNLVSTELNGLTEHVILQRGNIVECFGVYKILALNGHCEVRQKSKPTNTFTNLRNAVSWCVADKHKNVTVSTQIKQLDTSLMTMQRNSSHAVSFAKTLRNKDIIRYYIITGKLSAIRFGIASITEQLDKLVNYTKYIQLKGFNNEPQRFN